jgi:hypothetical protein
VCVLNVINPDEGQGEESTLKYLVASPKLGSAVATRPCEPRKSQGGARLSCSVRPAASQKMSSAAGPSGVDSIGPNQQFYSPPPSLNAVQSEELRRWAVEAALGQGIPTDYQQRGVDPASIQSRTRSFKRRHVPSWVLPGRPVVYVTNLRCVALAALPNHPRIFRAHLRRCGL